MRAPEKLELLLSEEIGVCRARESCAFDQVTGNRKGLVLFGAGGLGRKMLAALRADGVEPLAFIDNKLAGKFVDNLEVMLPGEAAKRWGASATFVVTIWASWADTMLEQVHSLRRLGCDNVTSFIPLLWKYPDLLPHVQINLPSRALEQRVEVARAFALLSDEASRAEFQAQLRWRLQGDFDCLNPPQPDQYFQTDLIHFKKDSVFVDAGAFDGDTLAQFIAFCGGRFRAAYAFEPDPANLRALRCRLLDMPGSVRERIKVLEAAVSDHEHDLRFCEGAGASSAAGAGDSLVHCVSLDDTVSDVPDLIKYDIEGFELLGLQGSQRIIREYAPALAVCAYHIQDHLWKIPNLIHQLNGDYRFYLRPHGQIWETVCYAIPRSMWNATGG